MPRAAVERMELPRKLEATCRAYQEIRRRGIRVVIGGDYGFNLTPMGENARDIGHFVKFFGYSPAEALRCATSVGGDLMGHAGELGVIREGALADLLLVDGNPLEDLSRARRTGPLRDDHEERQGCIVGSSGASHQTRLPVLTSERAHKTEMPRCCTTPMWRPRMAMPEAGSGAPGCPDPKAVPRSSSSDRKGVHDVSRHVATISALLDLDDPAGFLRTLPLGEPLGTVEALLRNSDRRHGMRHGPSS